VHHEAVSALTRLNACQPHEPVARPRELGVVAHRARQGGDGFALVGDVVVECYDQSVRILHHLGAPEVTGSRADVVLNGDDHQLAVHQADQLLSFLLGVPCALADRSLGGYRQIPCNVAAVGLLEQDGTQALFESREAFVGGEVAGYGGHAHRYVRKRSRILRIAGGLKRRGLLLSAGSDGSIPTAALSRFLLQPLGSQGIGASFHIFSAAASGFVGPQRIDARDGRAADLALASLFVVLVLDNPTIGLVDRHLHQPASSNILLLVL